MIYNRYLDNIKTYEVGKPIELVVREFGIKPEDVVKLASNENPLGAPPKAIKAIKDNASKAYLYPDDSMYELKEALCKRFDIDKQNIIIGAGSDQIIEFISHIRLNENSSILTSKVTFAMYEIYAKSFGAKVIKTSSYKHIPSEFKQKIKEENPDIIYICTPNNPTGDATPKDDVFEIINSAPKDSIVVVDGAYMEYVDKDEYKILPKELLSFPNVIYLGTFSKAYGLGGMRVGYGIANKELIELLYKVRPPFNITTLSLVAAINALEDKEFVKETIALNKEQMRRYIDFAKKYNIEYIPSFTNFI
ncbi:MAG: histidinol-phosphate transaminase, partial [Epsilonproteobacteria bacterium]|nr:histidinol-phosphate transaminase [Campylobacterota bacterium]